MRKWYALCLTLTFLFLTQYAFTQTGKLSGRIVDEHNAAVVGASVKVLNTEMGTLSDVDGRFTLTLSEKKTYTIQISAVGYETKEISDIEVKSSEVTLLTINLSTTVKNLDNVVVKNFCKKKKAPMH